MLHSDQQLSCVKDGCCYHHLLQTQAQQQRQRSVRAESGSERALQQALPEHKQDWASWQHAVPNLGPLLLLHALGR